MPVSEDERSARQDGGPDAARPQDAAWRRKRPLAAIAVLVFAASLLLLAACGSDDDGDDSGSASDSGVLSQTDPFAGAEELYEGYTGDEEGLPREYPEATEADNSIGWLTPLASQIVLATQLKAAEAEVENLGGSLTSLDDQVSPDKQVSNFNQLLAQKVDAIELIPIDPRASDPLIAKAADQNVPVLAYDKTNTLGEDAGQISTQIWQGRDHQAYAMANLMSQLSPGGRIGLIGFGFPVPNIIYLMERLEFWADHFGLEVVDQVESRSDDAAGGEQAMQGLLGKQLDGIIGYTDAVTIGANATARGAGQDLVTVSVGGGPGTLDAVKAGNLTGSFQYDAVQQGVEAVRGIYNLIAGTDVPEIVLMPPRQLITEATADEVVSWDDELGELTGG